MDSKCTYRGLENSWLTGRWEGGWSSRDPACTSRGGGWPKLCPDRFWWPRSQLPGYRGAVLYEEAVRATQTLAAPLWTWFPHLQKEGLIYMVAVMACSCHFLLLTELQLALGFRVHMGYRRGVGVKGREGDGKATGIKAWDFQGTWSMETVIRDFLSSY